MEKVIGNRRLVLSLMDSSTSYLKRTKVISYYLFPVTYYLKKVISYSLLFIPYSLFPNVRLLSLCSVLASSLILKPW